jgi:hypothetical protein
MNKALEKYIRDHGIQKSPSAMQKVFTKLIRRLPDNINVTKNK